MPRPIKDNADYFSHDADMRDDPKIKALRRKYKIAGYGVWCMLLEAITDSDHFRLAVDPEIIAGDFDVDTDFLNGVIAYCLQIDLLQSDDNGETIYSRTMDKRFEGLLSKRKRDRKDLSTAITPRNGHIVAESTQSKVKESIVQESTGEKAEAFADPKAVAPDILQKAADLTDAICDYFAVKKIATSKIYNSVFEFVSTITHRNELEIACIALQRYMAYKARSQEQRHNVINWIGTKDAYYQDGQWIMTDWDKKVNGIQYDRTNGKGSATPAGSGVLTGGKAFGNLRRN